MSVSASSSMPRRRLVRAGSPDMQTWATGAALAVLVIAACTTSGFASLPNLIALTGTLSLIGCVAVGMTFITLSGNIMSFSLGATCAATAMLVAYLSGHGFVLAAGAGLVLAMALTAAQGLLIGVFRANPLIVSIAFLSLMLGVAQYIAGGQSIYVHADALNLLKGRLAGVPIPLLVFLGAVVAGEAVLRLTKFGQNVIFVGANIDAAVVAGIRPWSTVAGSYLAAGLFTGVSGILLAARYGSGSMEFGVGFDYSAISAVLVGGTAIGGGHGSVLRTMAGVVFIGVLQSLLLLHGLDVQYQYLFIGLIVLAAILLQSRRRGR